MLKPKSLIDEALELDNSQQHLVSAYGYENCDLTGG